MLQARSLYVSPKGNDSNKGNHWFVPLRTLAKAQSMVQPGDTVHIMNGDYYSESGPVLWIDKSGTENQWIVYKNYLSHKPVFHVRHGSGIQISNAHHISIEGIYIAQDIHAVADEDHLQTGIHVEGSYENPCTHIKIFNCFIRNLNGPAVRCTYFDYLTLSYNKFFGNAYATNALAVLLFNNIVESDDRSIYHVYIQANTMERNSISISKEHPACNPLMKFDYHRGLQSKPNNLTLIHNNILYENGGGALWFQDVLGFHIINNTLYKNCQQEFCNNPEIAFERSTDCKVYNNIVYCSSARKASSVYNGVDIWFKNNLYYNFSYHEQGINDLIANPEFENVGNSPDVYNFRLKGNSPAINAGVDELLPDIDFEGNPRKIDFHTDIGALEFTNRILPSLKSIKTGPQGGGKIKSSWSSLYLKDQGVYTLWNELHKGFSVRIYDNYGTLIFEEIRSEEGESGFEFDFNRYPPANYSVVAFNTSQQHIDRVSTVKPKQK